MKKFLLLFFLLSLVVIAGCDSPTGGIVVDTDKEVTVYKSPTCGCCVGWSSYMMSQGFEVDIETVNNLDIIKAQYNIPKNLESCHTAIVGDYIVEGHIPIEIIDKLLNEKPDIDGIALPRMPSGSPGMPGPKRGEWIIYSIKDGQYSEYIRV